jgi:hypothetical protein
MTGTRHFGLPRMGSVFGLIRWGESGKLETYIYLYLATPSWTQESLIPRRVHSSPGRGTQPTRRRNYFFSASWRNLVQVGASWSKWAQPDADLWSVGFWINAQEQCPEDTESTPRGTLQNNRNNVTLSLTPKDSFENNRNINRNGYGHDRNTGPGP